MLLPELIVDDGADRLLSLRLLQIIPILH